MEKSTYCMYGTVSSPGTKKTSLMLTKQKFVLYEAVAVLRIIQQVEQRASRTQLHNNNLK